MGSRGYCRWSRTAALVPAADSIEVQDEDEMPMSLSRGHPEEASVDRGPRAVRGRGTRLYRATGEEEEHAPLGKPKILAGGFSRSDVQWLEAGGAEQDTPGRWTVTINSMEDDFAAGSVEVCFDAGRCFEEFESVGGSPAFEREREG